jgi:hypothetical protein
MKRSILARVCQATKLISFLAVAPTGPAIAKNVDPVKLYGNEIRFDVLRDGDKVGAHVVRFARDRDTLFVHSKFDLAIRLLGFTIYDYRYVSRALWRDGRLIELEARTDDDGKEHWVRAGVDGEGLEVNGPAGRFVAPMDVLPTNHWNAVVLGSDRVLNTLTGNLNRVEIVDLGDAVVETAAGRRAARHFRYTGELETEVWYDARGRWVKLRFQAKDGSTIDYVCRKCGDGK